MRTNKKSILISSFLPLVILSIYFLNSCNEKDNLITNSQVTKQTQVNNSLFIDVSDSTKLAISLNNANVISDLHLIEEQLKKITPEMLDDFEIIINESQTNSLSKTTGDIKKRIGDYYVRLSLEKHFIGSCISRNVWHVGIMVSKYKSKNIPLVNIHFCGWKQNGKICYGIYNSGSSKSFCWTKCSPKIKDITKGVSQALVAVGLTAATAYMVAEVLTPLAIGVLAL
jgi:hypothetical protein